MARIRARRCSRGNVSSTDCDLLVETRASTACREWRKWGIRLTQGMPTSCGRADPIPADYTACRGHLSEADTHLEKYARGLTAQLRRASCGHQTSVTWTWLLWISWVLERCSVLATRPTRRYRPESACRSCKSTRAICEEMI